MLLKLGKFIWENKQWKIDEIKELERGNREFLRPATTGLDWLTRLRLLQNYVFFFFFSSNSSNIY